jgi:hypothetical protein
VLGAALLASAALGLGLLSACGSGQITGTDTQVSAVPGVNGQSADGMIALRDGMVDYADEYKPGSTVPLSMRLFNNSKQAVKLTGATSANGDVVLIGGASASASPSAAASASSASPTPSGSRKPSGSASASTSTSSSQAASASPAPTSVGSSKISIGIPVGGIVALSRDAGTYLAVRLRGTTLEAAGALGDVKFTFTYADGSTTTLELPEVPMNVPLTPLPKPSPVVPSEGV